MSRVPFPTHRGRPLQWSHRGPGGLLGIPGRYDAPQASKKEKEICISFPELGLFPEVFDSARMAHPALYLVAARAPGIHMADLRIVRHGASDTDKAEHLLIGEVSDDLLCQLSFDTPLHEGDRLLFSLVNQLFSPADDVCLFTLAWTP